MALVSVVIATYNRVDLLRDCLAAVQAQTFSDWECVVCDDGSTDGSLEMVGALADGDYRFRVSTGERHGRPAGPRNRGIAQARGTWIAFVDDDDLWHPEKLERQLKAAKTHSADAVSTNLVMFGGDDPPPQWNTVKQGGQDSLLSLEGILALQKPYPSTPANLIQRDWLLKVGGFAEHAAYRAVEDYDLWSRLQALPGFRWIVVGGPALTAARVAGTDSISSWRRISKPDFLRQQWAMLEILSRITAAERDQLVSSRQKMLEMLTRMADDCAHRCRLVGWRRESIFAYRLSARLARACGDPKGALMRLVRAVRFGALGKPVETVPIPESVPLLQARISRSVDAIIASDVYRQSPLPIASHGAWSALPAVVASASTDSRMEHPERNRRAPHEMAPSTPKPT